MRVVSELGAGSIGSRFEMAAKLVTFLCFLHLLEEVDLYPTNLFIGTGGDGFGVGSTPPGAQYPFGFMRLSPDTAEDNIVLDWRHFGGYYYGDNEIRCFAHTHMMGAGVVDYGHIGVMATREMSSKIITNEGYRSKFSHQNETAYPGFYSVMLHSANVFVELTVAGPFTGLHRYKYFGDGRRYLIFNPTHAVKRDTVTNSSVIISNYKSASITISGWSIIKGSLTGRNGFGVKVYFIADVTGKPVGYGTWKNSEINNNGMFASGKDCGAYIEFSQANDEVGLVIALSLISVEQAKANLANEFLGQSFDNILIKATDEWNSYLKQVEVMTTDVDLQTKFYTALYHTFAAPTTFSEANGMYLGVDNKVHRTLLSYYSDLSLWDIHRTQAPLLTFLKPNVSLGIINSLVTMYEEGGALPRWPIANVYGGSMIGNHGYEVILDGYVKGVLPNNLASVAYEAMKDEATRTNLSHNSRPCLSDYLALGYCPMESAGNSVSLTLAYAYDDWAVGVMADLLNKSEDAEIFYNHSKNYKNVWNKERELMCPRSKSGEFHCPFDPTLNTWIIKDAGFTEGNAEQWRWFVPHDVPGLVRLFKSNSSFIAHLSEFFEGSMKHPSNFLPNPYYWAGNEPDLLAVYLFNYVERADLTQKYVRWLLDNKYTTEADGLPGNDDYGTMSAWFVWSTFGLYPLPGTDKYFLGSPAIDTATLHFENGKDLKITAINNSKKSTTVQRVELNGHNIDLSQPFVEHSELLGGSLIFWMKND